MRNYEDFREESNLKFAFSSSYPTQEAHLVHLNWQDDEFWQALGLYISSCSRGDERFPSERSEHLIVRDGHLQAILDVLGGLQLQHQRMLLDRSAQMCVEHDLLGGIEDAFRFPIHRLLSDMGAGGVATLSTWVMAIAKVTPSSLARFDSQAPGWSALRLACHLSHEPYDAMTNGSEDELEKVVWLLAIHAIASERQGLSADLQVSALESLAQIKNLQEFPGWALVKVLESHRERFMLIDRPVSVDRHPFDNPELNVGNLVWRSTSSGVLSQAAWEGLVSNQADHALHFVRMAANKRGFDTAPRLRTAISQFLNANPEACFGVELSLEGFKNLEAHGLSRDVLIRHPQATEAYSGALFSRDLGL